jgi:hypothetical protein
MRCGRLLFGCIGKREREERGCWIGNDVAATVTKEIYSCDYMSNPEVLQAGDLNDKRRSA